MTENPLFQLCKKHHFGIDKPEKVAQSPDESKFLMKTFSQIKSNVAVPIKKKVFLCYTLYKNLFYHLQNHTLPFLSFPLFKALRFTQDFAFFALPTYRSFLSARPIQYSPAFQVKENKEKERLERRLLDELYKIFMDSDSFYYSMTYDLTNSVQRQGDSDKTSLPLWKQVWREMIA